MKKLLILSYYYPPGNFAGSYRVKSWADHLHQFGYYPIIITRHWDENETDFTAISSKKNIEKEENEYFIVYRLPYKGTLRDRLVNRYGPESKAIGKFFSFFQVIAQNFFMRSVPYSNLYDFSRDFLKKNTDIEIVIASGRPFLLFKFCWLLKKEFPRIKWVADYRDPWNTSEVIKSPRRKFFRFIEKPFEKKWLSNSAFFTTCSDEFINNINNLVNKKGYVITNGFEDFVHFDQTPDSNAFTIGYVGSLYENQEIEIFLSGFHKFLHKNPNAKIILNFLGLGKDSEAVKRIRNFSGDISDHIEFFGWLEKEELKKQAGKCHCFLLCGIPTQKGRHTAKFFDYLSFQKPILLCPSDKNILEQAINECNVGDILENEKNVIDWINSSYNEWEKNNFLHFSGAVEEIKKYRYENQVRNLVPLLKSIESL